MEKETKETPKKETKKTTYKEVDKESKKSENSNQNDVKASEHAARYLAIGTSLALFNYIFYTVLSNLIIKNNDLLWLSSFISTGTTTILAYILHSRITWKERPISKTAVYKFFIWNIMLTVAIGPILTQLFSLITPLYDFAFHFFENLHIPFSYEFTLTTGTFILTTIVTTIMNYFLYDKFVFGKSKNQQKERK